MSGARIRLIEVGERLMAERGVNGVSLREIGAVAEQRNTGAVRYHFGSKTGLIDAIFEHRMTPINAQRMAMLDEFDRAGRGHDIRALTEAMLYPLDAILASPGRPSWYLRFCVQTAYVEGTAAVDLGRQEWTEGVDLIRSRFLGLLRDLPEAVRLDRWFLFAMFLIHALADRETVMQYRPNSVLSERTTFLAGLVDAAVALATAPASLATLGNGYGRRSNHTPTQEAS